jgi:hypothetical protein
MAEFAHAYPVRTIDQFAETGVVRRRRCEATKPVVLQSKTSAQSDLSEPAHGFVIRCWLSPLFAWFR